MPAPISWKRILPAVAIAVAVFSIGSAFWLSNPPETPLRNLSPACEAQLILRLDGVVAYLTSTDDTSLRCGGPDRNTFVWMLRSAELNYRTISSLNHSELQQVFGPSWLQNGKTLLQGLRVDAYSEDESLIRITARHPNPAAAQLILARHCRQFAKYLREISGRSDDSALLYLLQRQGEIQARAQRAEQVLAESKRTQKPDSIREAEIAARIEQDLLRNIEKRIAETKTAHAQEYTLPFSVAEASLTEGPFWNRVQRDISAEAKSWSKD